MMGGMNLAFGASTGNSLGECGGSAGCERPGAGVLARLERVTEKPL